VLGALAGVAAALLGGAVMGRAPEEDTRSRGLARAGAALGLAAIVLFVVILVVAAAGGLGS
jgi:hypothetical protein